MGDPNHAVFLRIQLRDSVENSMLLALAAKVLGSKFFDVLRTQQQLGYIVQMAQSNTSAFDYLVAVIQTEYPPDYIRARIDKFLEEQLEAGEALGEEEFETCRAG